MSEDIENRREYVIMSDALRKRMFTIFVNSHYDPRLFKTPHFHIDIEIMLIKSGRGYMQCCGEVLEVKTGDVLFFRSMEPHHIFKVNSRYPLKYICFSFAKNILLAEKEGWIDKSLLNIIEDRNDHFCNKLSLAKEGRDAIWKLVLEIEKELMEDASRNSYVIKCKFLEMITRISVHYNGTPKKPLGNMFHKNIDRSIVYMNQHLTDPLTLEDLADAAQMGISHYSAYFKKIMGVSPWHYFLERRINLAIKYLTDAEINYKITTISGMCGFNSTVNFNKVFKRITGKSPSEYRKWYQTDLSQLL